MATALVEFSDWLGNKLKDLNTDENVFGDYITGILDSDETTDEKNEALQDLLTEIVQNQSINELCAEIMEMWLKFKSKESPPTQAKPLDVDIKLKELTTQHCLPNKQKQYTAEEKKIKEAILAQYSQMSDDDDEEAEGVAPVATGAGNTGMEKNTNAYNVAQAEKEKRETAKLDSQKKKDKDREDREKQKQLKEDKKEKRKTQKGERRR